MKKRRKRYGPWITRSLFSKIRSFSLFTMVLLCLTFSGFSTGHAVEITLLWNKNTEKNIGGYKVYSGLSSRNYAADPICQVDSNWNSCTVTVPLDGKTRYFAVRAYNTEGRQSDFSNEASYKSPNSNGSSVTYTISASSNDQGGYIYPVGTLSVSSGNNATFQITPTYGIIASVWVDGAYIGTPTSYTFNDVTSNHSITVQFN